MSGLDTATHTGRGLNYTLPGISGALWLGLDATSLGGLGATLLVAVLLMLNSAPLWLPLLIATAGAASSAWPIHGRSSLQWLPLMLRHTSRLIRRHDTWSAPLGDVAFAAECAGDLPLDLPVPRGWGRLQLADCPEPGAGLLVNRARGTVTAVLEVTGTGRFGLLDRHAQDSELGRWGTALASLLALPELRHLQWLTHTRPQPLPPHTEWRDGEAAIDRAGGAARDRGVELASDYALLVNRAHTEALSHTHLLALTLNVQGNDEIRDALRQAAAALLAADLLCCPITTARLPRLLRLLLDPELPDDPETSGGSAIEPVVISLRSGWAQCQTDDSHHRAYALTGWPRLPLPPDWLSPLLHHPPAGRTARTLVVHARPVAPQHAARRARATATNARLDDADRRRLGFGPAAGGALDELDAENTENELLAGYPMADISVLLTLHAPDRRSLQVGASNLRTLSVSQRIDLRPLHGQHSAALAAALPVGHLPGART